MKEKISRILIYALGGATLYFIVYVMIWIGGTNGPWYVLQSSGAAALFGLLVNLYYRDARGIASLVAGFVVSYYAWPFGGMDIPSDVWLEYIFRYPLQWKENWIIVPAVFLLFVAIGAYQEFRIAEKNKPSPLDDQEETRPKPNLLIKETQRWKNIELNAVSWSLGVALLGSMPVWITWFIDRIMPPFWTLAAVFVFMLVLTAGVFGALPALEKVSGGALSRADLSGLYRVHQPSSRHPLTIAVFPLYAYQVGVVAAPAVLLFSSVPFLAVAFALTIVIMLQRAGIQSAIDTVRIIEQEDEDFG